MKKVAILLLLWIGGITMLSASDACHQQMSPEEFRAKQQSFITEKAGLTSAEAAKFFPVYFELQDKKKELNQKMWKCLHQGKDDKTTDEQYEDILLKVYDLRMESDQLDKSYYSKFKAVLSPKKIYLVQRAEMKFQRELVKGVHRGGEGPKRGKK